MRARLIRTFAAALFAAASAAAQAQAADPVRFGLCYDLTKIYVAAPTWLLGLAWRLESIRSLITRSSPLATRATVQSSITNRSYSNKKVKALLGYNFRTLAESAANVSAFVSGAGR